MTKQTKVEHFADWLCETHTGSAILGIVGSIAALAVVYGLLVFFQTALAS